MITTEECKAYFPELTEEQLEKISHSISSLANICINTLWDEEIEKMKEESNGIHIVKQNTSKYTLKATTSTTPASIPKLKNEA